MLQLRPLEMRVRTSINASSVIGLSSVRLIIVLFCKRTTQLVRSIKMLTMAIVLIIVRPTRPLSDSLFTSYLLRGFLYRHK